MGTSSREINPKAADNGEGWFPETDAEFDALRKQLQRLLASDLFTTSKRYPNLLRYIVEETLAGKASQLKERTLGVEVFGRDPSYDTNLDPVVRTSAAQVRHRVTQYYAEAGHETEIRIELTPGSYVPQFRRPGGNAAVVTELPLPEVVESPPVWNEAIAAPPEPSRPILLERHRRLKRYAFAAGALGLAVGAWFVLAHWLSPSAVTEYWGPVWDKSNAMVICVPGQFPKPDNPTQTSGVALPAGRDPRTPLTIKESLSLNSIKWPDASTLYMLVGFIQSHGQQYHVRREGDLPFSDLRTGPVVMVGGFNNQWLMRLTNRYRFSYQTDDKGVYWIHDAQNPSRKDWIVFSDRPYSTFDEDYGIISRVWDTETEHWVVVASGIAAYGTIAAGEFLTNPADLEMLAQHAPKGWERKNLQVLFATKVFNGNAGPPRIITVHIW
jgi:hypothetical protein